MSRVLVIEDHEDLAFGLRNNLEIEGYEVALAADGLAGMNLAKTWSPDLVVLDLMLPGLDGFRVLRSLREQGLTMPILILTARGEEADKVRGLRLGADDYVTKPFGILELLARAEALLRRSRLRDPGVASSRRVTRFGQITVEPARRAVRRSGEPVELTPKEFDLLTSLIRAEGVVVSRMDLLRSVWGYSESVVSRTVDTHIAELRRKLEADPSRPRHILTVRKAGYRLAR
jgi:two-component system, OmpR family, alkaline phosphatase synthesis response regulator PhoP